jgi:hypothetical protein
LSSFFRLGVNGNIVVSGTSPYITFNTATNSGSTPAYIQFTNATSKFDIVSTGAIEFFSNANARMRLFGTGNLGINTGATDGGQRLQVQGDAFIKGSGNTGSTSALLVQNSSGTEMFTVRNDGRVLMQSVGSISVGGTIQFNNTVGLTNIEGNPNITNGGRLTFLSGGPQSSYIRCLFDTAYVASSGTSTGTTITDNLTINLTGTATGTAISFLANPTITSLAGSSTYRAFQWNNNSGWGLYGAGTANNFLGGNLTVSRTHNAETSIIINNSSDNAAAYSALRVRANGVGEVQLVKFSQSTTAYKICQPGDGVLFNNGSYGDIAILNDRTAGIIKFAAGASSTAQMTLTAAGRLLLGTTTESTFLLDVNGTARVSGLITGNANARLTGLYPYLELKPDGWSSPLYIQSGLNAALSNVGDYTAFQNPTGKGYLFTSGSTNAIHINPTNANVALNGTADSGYRLYINRGTTANGALAVVGGITDFAASTTSYASLQINPGVAPTSPVNGNIWFDGTDLKMRIGGVTKTFTLV